MRVCIVGGGGREHALAHVLARSADVIVTPGNPAIPGSVTTSPEAIEADLFVIGPEAPLVDGLADRLRAQGRLVFGPGADGARLEGSKAFMKELLASAGVPTAGHRAFTDPEPAIAYLRSLAAPFVVKTDGLAAGKGVLVTESIAEAEADVREKLSGESFGAAGERVVIEEGLTGPELSLLVVCDGTRAVPLAPAQDFKRLGDGDAGPNTGGMGAYSPVPGSGPEIVDLVMDRAVEYNVRFGDPEAQVVLPRLASDLAGLLADAAAGALSEGPRFVDEAAVTVVLAVEGYPTVPRTGDRIEGLAAASGRPGVTVFAAGVGAAADGHLVTAGGRVLNVTGTAPTIAAARDVADAAAAEIHWPGCQFRRDIAASAATAERKVP